MDTTAWIWVAIAIIVVLLIVVILLKSSRARRMRHAEEQKEEARRQAGRLREDAQESGLTARENQAAAARTAADAEQAAVDAERLRIEAERQHAVAAEGDARSKEKLQEAATIDPDVDASKKRGTSHDGGVDTTRASSEGQASDVGGKAIDDASVGSNDTLSDDQPGSGRQARRSKRPDDV